jgi:hypothetical protein
MKRCTRCRIPKQPSEFHKNKPSKDGLHPYCKQCRLAHKKQKDMLAAKNPRRCGFERIRRVLMSELRRRGLRWCSICKEAKTPDLFVSKPDGPCLSCNYSRVMRWRQNNPQKFRALTAVNNASRRDSMPTTAQERALAREYVRMLAYDPCSYCGGTHKHADHIVPVVRGGTGVWDNFTSSCAPCNHRKTSKPLLMFLLEVS